jgi:hypothetical protein
MRYSLPTGSIGGMFDVLRAAGETKRGCRHPSKEAAIKDILIYAGLATYLDKGYVTGYVGRKIGLGPKHPLHTHFARVLARYPVVTARQIHRRWAMEEQQRMLERRATATAAPARRPFECPPPSLNTQLVEMIKPTKRRSFTKMMTKKEREEYAALQAKLANEPGHNFVAVERALVAFRTPIRQRDDAKRRKRQVRDKCIRAITNEVLMERGWHASIARDAAFTNARKSAAKEARQRIRAAISKGGTPDSIMNDLGQKRKEEFVDRTCQFRLNDETDDTTDNPHEQGAKQGGFADRLEDTCVPPHDQMSGVAGMELPLP